MLWFGWLGCCGISTPLVTAKAQETEFHTATLEWSRGDADECISAERLRAAVASALERPVFVASKAADLRVNGEIWWDVAKERWMAQLELRRADGSIIGVRRVASETSACASIDEPLALVIALMIDVPELIAAPEPPEPSPSVRRTTEAVRIGASVSGGVLVGPTPNPTFAPSVSVFMDARAAFTRFALEGGLALKSRAEDSAGGLADVGAYWAGLWLCPGRLLISKVELRGCLGGQWNAFVAEGNGFDRNLKDTVHVASAGAAGDVEWLVMEPIVVRLAVRGLVPHRRLRFVATGPDGTASTMYSGRGWILHAGVGLGARW